jgi:hypothetical protein
MARRPPRQLLLGGHGAIDDGRRSSPDPLVPVLNPVSIRVSLTESALCRLPNRQRARVSVIEHRTILCDERQIVLDGGRASCC